MVTMGMLAKVAAAFDIGRGRSAAGIDCACSMHLGRELVRQVMLADDDLDIDAEIVGVAQDFDHAAHRRRASLGVFEQFDIDHHAVQFGDAFHFGRGHADAVVRGSGGGRKLHAVGNIDPLLDAAVGGHHVAAAAADFEFADHGGVGALQHLDDFAIGAAAGLDAGDADDHAVAVHGLFGGLGRDENVAGRCRESDVRR